jgi:hypothetical protein
MEQTLFTKGHAEGRIIHANDDPSPSQAKFNADDPRLKVGSYDEESGLSPQVKRIVLRRDDPSLIQDESYSEETIPVQKLDRTQL